MSDKISGIISSLEELNVLELNNLVKSIEDKWGVSAAAAAVAAAPAAGGGAAAAVEEKTEFKVTLKEVGADKIKVIKVVREVTDLGLKEAKDLVDGAPKVVKDGVSKQEAEDIKKKFSDVGATIVVD
jgi:large subunit ribosomal protein L7/L12